VIYGRIPPDPGTTLDEAIASSPGLSHAVLKRSRTDATVVVFLPGTGLVVSKQSVTDGLTVGGLSNITRRAVPGCAS
jgi:hypothetical protein